MTSSKLQRLRLVWLALIAIIGGLSAQEEAFISLREEMPIYPVNGCDTLATYAQRRECSNQSVIADVYAHLQWPEDTNIPPKGQLIVVTFTVGKDGWLSDFRVVRGISPALDSAALAAVCQLYQPWVPATQRDKVVPVQFNFPIRYGKKE